MPSAETLNRCWVKKSMSILGRDDRWLTGVLHVDTVNVLHIHELK